MKRLRCFCFVVSVIMCVCYDCVCMCVCVYEGMRKWGMDGEEKRVDRDV